MASEEKNALAELANELHWIEDILRSEGYEEYGPYADKAQRIIAELAKVEVIKGSDLVCNPGQAVSAVESCRAIAEEKGGK